VAISLALGAVAALLGGLAVPAGPRIPLLGLAAGIFFVWGFLGIFSIGLPLFAAGALTILAAGRLRRSSADDAALGVTLLSGGAFVILGVVVTG
jgi:hypothetical protein